ncbi:MAG: amidophosphoribosyltransferase [Sphingobacteriales bacterium 17-39-43]|nr:MAG: amidophosphoribosyltransferase [Sphingobacteriales bacterium 16-39-50]OZA24819.1 MAG: amidophosphoribosyltransferase [Sphingobacteriales bacterium 17-39-43]
MKRFLSYLNDFFCLFFPELCAACGRNLFRNEKIICTNCIYHLPRTNFHIDTQNKMARQLWGRFNFEQAIAFVYFQKGNRVQNLMHQLKYNKKPEVGIRIGELYAWQLIRSEGWVNPDLIIPIPLHPVRLKKRGYNQSEEISKGLASVLKLPVSTQHLIRTENTESQTKKSRFARYENLKDAFIIKNATELIQKHIILVDDVMTTGATVEACSNELLKIEGLKISICTLAYAE